MSWRKCVEIKKTKEMRFSFRFFFVCVWGIQSSQRCATAEISVRLLFLCFFFFLLKHFLLFDRFPRLRFLWLPFFFSFLFFFTFGHRRVVHLCVGQRNEKGTETSSGSSSSSSSFFSLSSFFFFFFLVFFWEGGNSPPPFLCGR